MTTNSKINKLLKSFVSESEVVSHNLYEGKPNITNKAVAKQRKIVSHLRTIDGGLESLKKLMAKENDRSLRSQVASFLFDDYTDEAIEVLKELAKGDDKLALSAKWGLKVRLEQR